MSSRRKKKPRYYVAPRRASSARPSIWVWAVTLLLLAFSGFIGWRIIQYGHFDDPKLIYNGWVRLASLSLVVAGLVTGAFVLRRPSATRRMHAAVFFALLLHLGLIIAVDEVYLTIAAGLEEEPEQFISLPDFGREEERDETLDPVNNPTEVATPRPRETEAPSEPPSPAESFADRAATDTPTQQSERQPATAQMDRTATARPHQGREQTGPARRSDASQPANPDEGAATERLSNPAPRAAAEQSQPNLDAAERSSTSQTTRRDSSQPAVDVEVQRNETAALEPQRNSQSPTNQATASNQVERSNPAAASDLDSPTELTRNLPATQQESVANARPASSGSPAQSDTSTRSSRDLAANQPRAAEPSSSSANVAVNQSSSTAQPALAQTAANNRTNDRSDDSSATIASEDAEAPAASQTRVDGIAAQFQPTVDAGDRSATRETIASGERSGSAGTPEVAASSSAIASGAPARVEDEAAPAVGGLTAGQGGVARRADASLDGGVDGPAAESPLAPTVALGGAAGGGPAIDAAQIGEMAQGRNQGQSGVVRSESGGNPGIAVVEGGLGGPAAAARESNRSNIPSVGDSGGSGLVVRAAPSPSGDLVGGASENPLPVDVASGTGTGNPSGGLAAGNAATATQRTLGDSGAANGRPATGSTGTQLATGEGAAAVAALNRRGNSAGDAAQPRLASGSGTVAVERGRTPGGQSSGVEVAHGASLAIARSGSGTASAADGNSAGARVTSPARSEGGGSVVHSRRGSPAGAELGGGSGEGLVVAAAIGSARDGAGQPTVSASASTGGATRSRFDGASVGGLDDSMETGPLPAGPTIVASTVGGEPGDDAGPASLVADAPGRSATGAARRSAGAAAGNSAAEGPSSGASIASLGPRRGTGEDGPEISAAAAAGGGMARRTSSAGGGDGIELAMAEPLPTGTGDTAAGRGSRGPVAASTSKSQTGSPLVRRDAASGPAGLLPGPSSRDLGIKSPLASRRGDEAHLSVARLGTSVRRAPLDAPLDVEVAAPAFKARDPIARRRTAEQRGGTPATEEAVERGLAFLAKHQLSDGRWSLQSFADGTHGGTVEDRGTMQSDSAATGLALLAYLGAGYTHQEELGNKYREVVQRGLAFLIRNQKQNGDLFTGGSEYCWLYSHGIAAIAVCEAYGMTHDEDLKRPAQRAIDFIVAAQNKELGGWRYKPGISSDTSVSGWQLMAMKSAEMSGLEVPASSYALVKKWLDHAQSPSQPAQYIYRPGAKFEHQRAPSHAMTAESMLMRLYLGWEKEHEQIGYGADYLLGRLPTFGDAQHQVRDTYYWYYGTQVMFHVGGERWNTWNEAMKKLLTESQVASGPLEGSWDPRAPLPDKWGPAAGRIYVTAMHLLMLEVYYRHLPLYTDKVTRQ